MIRHTKQHRDTLDPANPRDYLGYFLLLLLFYNRNYCNFKIYKCFIR